MLEYRYPHFTRSLLVEDIAFRGGPAPGEQLPDFELPTIDGRVVSKSDFVGQRPLLITLASITCPMTAASRDILLRLHSELGDRVAFLTVYVREAYPGESYPQARDLAHKFDYARAYHQRDRIPWTIAIDDVDGNFHRALDAKPNAAYVMAIDGTVAFRSLWSNDERALRKALRSVTEGRAPGQIQSHLVPMLGGIGRMYDMLRESGPTARKDVRKQLPPMYLLARIANIYRPLPPVARTVAAMATSLALVFAAGAVLTRLVRH